MKVSPRIYRSPIRKRQSQQTRAGILDALTALIESGGETSYAAIAKEAEIQERTVYRHFPTRKALYEAFWTWIHHKHFASPVEPTNLGSLFDLVAQVFSGFSNRERLVRAMLHSPEGRSIRRKANDTRVRRFELIARVEAPQLSSGRKRRAAAATQVLCSAMTWEYLRDYWGMHADEASATVRQAIEGMFAGLRQSAGRARRSNSNNCRKTLEKQS